MTVPKTTMLHIRPGTTLMLNAEKNSMVRQQKAPPTKTPGLRLSSLEKFDVLCIVSISAFRKDRTIFNPINF